jgi:hypothetical protein
MRLGLLIWSFQLRKGGRLVWLCVFMLFIEGMGWRWDYIALCTSVLAALRHSNYFEKCYVRLMD